MAANDRVDFIVVGDAPPPSVLPPNVRFETIAYTAMQARLTQLTGRSVVYTNTYKANDIKPLLPALYPEAIRGYEWWGWADLDVIFGDLLKFVELALAQPACCRGLEYGCTKRAWRDPRSPCFNSSRGREPADTYGDRGSCRCREGERVTAISPLYPNPWRKKCWGPFTLFRVSAGARLFEETPKWRAALATAEYTHFDEWWGPFVQQGFESMGDVMTRLSDEGRLVMSRARLPFSEAKSCVDIECTFCPCGATRFVLRGRTLTVNDEESMILHLAEAKPAWLTLAANAAAGAGGSAGWRVPAYAPGQSSCFEGRKRAGRAPLRMHSRRLKARRATVYDLKGPPIKGVPCLPEVVEDDPLDGRTDSGAQNGASPTEVQSRLAEVQERIFDAYLQLQKVQRDERARTRRWMCSWLYKLKACDDAEALQRRLGRRPSDGAVLGVSTRLVALAAPVTTRRCRRIAPPDHAVSTGDPALGWGGLHVPQLNSTAMNALLFRFRCW